MQIHELQICFTIIFSTIASYHLLGKIDCFIDQSVKTYKKSELLLYTSLVFKILIILAITYIVSVLAIS